MNKIKTSGERTNIFLKIREIIQNKILIIFTPYLLWWLIHITECHNYLISLLIYERFYIDFFSCQIKTERNRFTDLLIL